MKIFITATLFIFSSVLCFSQENTIVKNISETREEANSTQRDYHCGDFKTGEFRYIDEHTDVKITRTKKYQIEETQERRIKLRIKWTSECTYTLTLVEFNNEADKENLGKTIYSEIILIDGDKITISSRMNGSRYTTKMEKIN